MPTTGDGAVIDARVRAALRAVATPELYRGNAFRIAGVSADASPRDLRRRGEQVRAVQRLGGAPGASGVLPLSPAPDADAVEQALNRLRNPVDRLVDELFWIWPQPDDPGYQALLAGDSAAAMTLWPAQSDDPAVLHNRAIVDHVRALDQYPRGARFARSFFMRAISHWTRAMAAEAFWERFAERVARLDHPGLGAAAVATVRVDLPECLSLIHATLAVRASEQAAEQAAEQGAVRAAGQGTGQATGPGAGPATGQGTEDETAAQQWEMARDRRFPPAAVQRATQAATDPMFERITALCDRGLQAARAAQRDSRAGRSAARQLHADALPLLRILELAGTPTFPAASDAVARAIRACGGAGIQAYWLEKDWRTVRDIFELARSTARGEGELRQVEAELAVIDTRIKRHEDLREQAERRRREAEQHRLDEQRRKVDEERRAAERRLTEAWRLAAPDEPPNRNEPAKPNEPPKPAERPGPAKPQRAEASATTPKTSICHYCGRLGGDARPVPVPMVRGAETRTIQVPRCRRCRRHHRSPIWLSRLLVLAAAAMLAAGILLPLRWLFVAAVPLVVAAVPLHEVGRRRDPIRQARTNEYLPIELMEEVEMIRQ